MNTRQIIAQLLETRDNNMDSEIVSVVAGVYMRVRVDSDARVRLTADLTTSQLMAVVGTLHRMNDTLRKGE